MPSEIMQIIRSQEESLKDYEQQSEDNGTQYLSFIVGDEEFSVSILRVQEIRAWELPTFLPNSPAYIRGVINLRGTIVPVMDLRIRLNFDQVDYDKTTVIIILKSSTKERERLMGCVVDAVSDVFNVEPSDIFDVPDCSSKIDDRFTLGIMTIDEHPVTLLDLECLLNLDLIKHPFTGGHLDYV